MASIPRIPSDVIRRLKNRRFRLDFRVLLDDAPMDISDWTIAIDVLNSNSTVIATWTEAEIERPLLHQFVIDVPEPSDINLVDSTQSTQYTLDIYRVDALNGNESFASATLHIDPKVTTEYAKAAANSEVIFLKYSSAAPGVTIEMGSALALRVNDVENMILGLPTKPEVETLAAAVNKPAVTIAESATRRFVTDAEKAIWNTALFSESPKGSWNAATNTPDAAATLTTNGDTFDVTIGGTATVTGESVAFGVGDKLKKTEAGLIRIPQALVPGVGAITTPSLALAAVTPDKTSFLVPGKNLFDRTATNNTDGYYLDNANTAVASGIYAYTDFIAVTPGLAYIGKGATNYIRYTTYFDANRHLVAGGSNTNVSTPFTIPAGVHYVRVTYWLADKDTFQFEQSTFATLYEPFQWQLPAEIPVRAVATDAITTPSLAPAAVTPDKTSFLVPSKNLFDRSAAGNETGKYIESNGAIFVNAGYNLTYLIPVQPNTWYYPSVKNRLGFFNSAGVFLSGEPHTRTNQQFQTPANTAYVRLSVPDAGWDSFQLETGTTGNAWEKYGRKLTGVSVTGVEPESTTFLRAGKNLFNLAHAGNVPLNYINSANGTLVGHASFTASHFIPVVAGEWYVPSFKNQLAFYDAGKVYISGLASGRTDQQFQAPAGAFYVRVTVDTINTFQLEKGTTKTAYERFTYVAKSADGRPVAPSYLSGDVLSAAVDLYQEPCVLAIAPKLYVPTGKEIAVYSENIHKNFLPYRDRTDVVITGGKKTGRGGKLTPVSAATINGTVTVGTKTFDALTSKSFQVIATSATLNTALKILNLGDSYTLRSTFVNALVAGAGTNVTFLGIRNSTQAPGIRCEGRGGWAVTGGIGYTTHNTTLYNPFVQPTATYLYLGNTSYWKAVLGAGGYDYDGIATPIKSQFNAATGYANAPRTNDLMYDNTLALYKAWDGSAWQTVTAPSFAFHFGKYRQCWGIDAPNVVHIMLGTNDFTNATESQFAGLYVPYKAGYDAMITSIKADTPTVKIIVGVPVSSGRQGEFGTLESERKKRTYWLLAEKLIADYAGREAESIIVNDYHSGTDRVHGYDITDDKPYADYPGADTEPYLADIIHIGNTRGFVQMGNQYYGLIQYLRGL